MTRKSNSNAKSLQEENESLKNEIESLRDKIWTIATTLKSSYGGHKQRTEMEKSLEVVGAEYDHLKGL